MLTGDYYLAGKVTDPDGKPLQNASVRLEETGEKDPSRPSHTSAQTDNEGKFRLDGLFDDIVTVSVSHSMSSYKIFEFQQTNRDDAVFVLDPADISNSMARTNEDIREKLMASEEVKEGKVAIPDPFEKPLAVIRKKGTAPITIDGDLAEWKALNTEIIPIEFGDPVINRKFNRDKFEHNPKKEDLSVSFQCFVDDHTFYIGVMVTDDIIKFGLNRYGVPFWEDCVEIYFFDDDDTYNGAGGQIFGDGQIWIAAEKDGTIKFEGKDSITKLSKIPYIWDALGARAAIKQHPQGYDVEIAVPLEFLVYSGWEYGRDKGMNIRVYDRDGDVPYLTGLSSMLEWAASPDDDYGLVTYEETDSEPAPPPFRPKHFDTVTAILEHLRDENWSEAELLLSELGDDRLSKPLKAMVLEKTQKKEEHFNTLIEIAQSSPNTSVSEWALSSIYTQSRRLEQYGDTGKVIDKLKKVLELSARNSMYYQIKLQLGKCYLQDGDNKKAKEVVEELLAAVDLPVHDPGSRITSEAKMLLSSLKSY